MPPPPPPAPPPLPKQFAGASKSSNAAATPDRNALLSQIRKGTQLKKSETNDRSAPAIDSKKSQTTNSNNGPVKQAVLNSNFPFPIIPPGGLFAQGIPKLRPTIPKSKDCSTPSSIVIQSIKSTHTASSVDHLRIGQLSGSRSQPPSPVSKPRLTADTVNRTVNSSINESMSLPCGNPNFPDDLTFKGPAPPPPPSNQKPVFKPGANSESVGKPTVRRSASQTNLGQRPHVVRPPPNVKPPPPPKSNNVVVAPQSTPPPPPSKPPNILRRQSFGVGEGSRFALNKLSVPSEHQKQQPVCNTVKGIGQPPPPPPPPPRNNSAPNDLNKIVGGNSSPSNHWNKMNIAPPPPPPPNRASGNRAGVVRPPPPRAPAPPPPPVPPQHTIQSHQTLAPTSKPLSANMAPPPPVRVSSMKQNNDFEERFKFHNAQNLPKPEKFSNIQKTYPSKANRLKQSTRRQPPPPPPQTTMDSGRSVVHIQLSSGIFNNVAHS